MDVKIDFSDKLLCMACLCVGRTLHRITNEKIKNYYLNALNEIPLGDTLTLCPIVCWECAAMLKRLLSFREQVKDSYRILQTYMHENLHECLVSDVSRPPRLKIHINDPVHINTSEAENDDQRDEPTDVQTVFVKKEVKCEFEKDVLSTNSDDENRHDRLSDYAESVKDETDVQIVVSDIKKASKNRVKKKKKKHKIDSKLRKMEKIMKEDKKISKSKPENKIITIDLTYEEVLLEREKELLKDSYVKAEYKCGTCLIGFSYNKAYKSHVSSKHSRELGDYSCPICKTIVSSVESFATHYKRHTRRFECSICHKRTADLKVMQRHYYTMHEITLKEYVCHLCGKISNSIDAHRYHKDTHKARVECADCDKTFSHRAGLMNHRLAVHELHNDFPCSVCGKVFKWKTSLKRHMENHQMKDKAGAAAFCTPCNVSFASVSSYQRHMKNSLKHVTQEQLRFICDHCNRRFADKTKLRDHIEEKHLHRTYQCHICLKPSKNRVNLDQHIRNVHKGRPNNKMCHHCGKGFPTKVQLESHIRTHTGERPFICEFCPTTFSQQSNLYKHNRQVHLNVKSKRLPPCNKNKKDGNQTETPAVNVSNHPEIYLLGF